MKLRKRRVLAIVALLTAVLAMGGIAVQKGNASDVTLTVVWHGGVCADMLLEIAKDWTKMTGVKVEGALVGYGPTRSPPNLRPKDPDSTWLPGTANPSVSLPAADIPCCSTPTSKSPPS